MRNILLITLFTLISGCSWMFPYEDEFACPRKDYMGKCVSSMDAYEEATTGTSKGEWAQAASKRDDDDSDKPDSTTERVEPNPNAGYLSYVQQSYKQQAKLLDQPITPLLKAPDVLEILVLSHPSDDSRMLWGNRYIHVIVEDSSFILGDYLKKKMIPVDGLF